MVVEEDRRKSRMTQRLGSWEAGGMMVSVTEAGKREVALVWGECNES